MKIYLLFALVFCGFVAAAQTGKIDTAQANDLKDVVITATRTEKTMMKVPVPIVSITAEEIRNRGMVRLNEILAEQTGLTIVNDHGQGVQMQGFDPQYTMIMIDGEPFIGRTAGTLELSRITLANIEKIEIVKGPTSSLYGSDAMAGVINIITAKQKNGLSTSLAARYGTNDNADVSLDLASKTDKLSISTFLNRYSSGGYTLGNSSSPTVVPFSSYTGNVKVGYQISSKSNLNLSVRYYETDPHYDYLINNRPVSADDSERNLNINPSFNIDFNEKVKAALRFYYSRYATRSDLQYKDDYSTYDNSFFTQNFSRGEFQTDYSVISNLKLTGGLGVQYETVQATRYETLRSFNSGYAYFQADYTPIKKLNVIAGGRYDLHSVYQSQFSPKLAASYQLLNNLTFIASVGKGYKAPDFRQLYLNFTNPVVGYSVFGYVDLAERLTELQQAGKIDKVLINPSTFEKLNAESSLSYNAGFRYAITPKLRLNANVFRNNIKNLINTVTVAIKTDDQSVFSYRNEDRVVTQGIEADLSYTPFKAVQLSAGFQYLDAFNQDHVNAIKQGNVYTRDPATNETTLVKLSDYGGLYNRSRYMANAAIAYNNNKHGIFGSLRAIYRGRYGISDLDGNNIVNMDSEYVNGYTLFNGSVSKLLIKERLRLQFTVDNIFNYKDVNFISNLPGRLFYGGITYTLNN
ncbi:TonB-dependent receptor plug domain-containing protein [Pedobacter endophyticus]|uniref:TonB-dependent receptor n=1 Tax=Pedobacter endophyticus TaxID=2789740 RepID=A0A7S9L0M4_9SPHI|nr:TonB-dependent receptor [Pedobacter endophyticus]QPH40320.1 TonB-dependent receptor [Pedobacter endophyticus]